MYKVKLDASNGPLDLLLHSIQKYEIDIYDISVKALTEQYMQYVHATNQLEINVTSGYSVMVSELLMIRNKLLLPQTSIEEGIEEDPREGLVGKLIEYQNYREYTEVLNTMKEERDLYFTKHPTDLTHLGTNKSWDSSQTIDLTKLVVAYQGVKNRVELNTPKSVEIKKETFTVQQATAQVTERSKQHESFNFFSLFIFHESVEQVVTYFLAILEMSKSGVVSVKQAKRFDDVDIIRGVNYSIE